MSAVAYAVPGSMWLIGIGCDWSFGLTVLFFVLGCLAYFVGIVHGLLSRAEYLRRYAVVTEMRDENAMKEQVRREFMGEAKKTVDDGTPLTPQKIALEEGYRMMTEMYGMYQSMADPRMKDEMAEIYSIAEKIYKYVADNPDCAVKIRKFNEYYFPEVLKMIRSYQEVLRIGASKDISDKMEGLLRTMVAAFQNQLDSLIYDKTLDMRTDMEVLEQMARRDGLSTDGLTGKL